MRSNKKVVGSNPLRGHHR